MLVRYARTKWAFMRKVNKLNIKNFISFEISGWQIEFSQAGKKKFESSIKIKQDI